MAQQLQKLKANMLVILGLTQNQHRQMLFTKRIFDAKIIEIENNMKNYKHLIRAILEVKVILKKMVQKIIQYFNQYTNILN